MLKKLAIRLPAPLVAAGIWFLSSQTKRPRPMGVFGFDKFQHLLAYMVLAAAVGLWFLGSLARPHVWRALVLIILISSGYGIIDEIHQYFVPGRDCNIRDWLADLAGAGIGTAVLWIIWRPWRRFLKRKQPETAKV